MDFSKPVNSSQNSIDISTDNITTAIRLPTSTYIYEGTLFISDGVMHMFTHDATPLINMVLNFNLKTQGFGARSSGQEEPQGAAIAFDTEKQVGWYYGGIMDSSIYRVSQDLYRLDRGKWTSTKVDVNSSSVGAVVDGELVYIKNIGEAGVLVLIGGRSKTQMVSMVDPD